MTTAGRSESLTCYKLVDWKENYDDYIDTENHEVQRYGPISQPEFEAMLYISSSSAHMPPWIQFISSGFGSISVPPIASSGSVLIVRIEPGPEFQLFAFTFGNLGRHLLRDYKWQRGYGLRTALNLIFPRGTSDEDLSRLIAVDTKRHSKEIMRTRIQSGHATAFETFDLDRLRDVVGTATGRPRDTDFWGSRINGGDALHFNKYIAFEELGNLCLEISVAHERTDYQEHFAWLDNIKPVLDHRMVEKLENTVLELLQSAEPDNIDLVAPEIVDWTQVRVFQFDFDKRSRITRPDLRLTDLLHGMSNSNNLSQINVEGLKRQRIAALDGSGFNAKSIHSWSVWRCLTGEIELDGSRFILDDGEFYEISHDFLKDLDNFIANLKPCDVKLPEPSQVGELEKVYNETVAKQLQDAILLDNKLVHLPSHTTPVEICDVLTKSKKLLHVKRGLGSRNLSHLFSQGFVVGELLQGDAQFRKACQDVIRQHASTDGFDFFDDNPITTQDFEIAYVIIADWKDQSLEYRIPFFSKVTLRRTSIDLTNRGYMVTCTPIPERPHRDRTPPSKFVSPHS